MLLKQAAGLLRLHTRAKFTLVDKGHPEVSRTDL